MKKFTFVDFAIVLVVIAVIAGGFFYLNSQNIIRTTGQEHETTFDFCVLGVEEHVADEINVGDMVYDSAKKIELGKIVRVDKQVHEDMYPDTQNGGYYKQKVDNRYSVILTVSTPDASYENGVLSVNNYELYLGKGCYIKGQNFALSSTVWRIDGMEGNGNEK
ncbi:MAG: DUF4330 domain-containing protein [Clostridia bacterium]|nr:DUF4330 domain-containing protein [Clostridia bacterium]